MAYSCEESVAMTYLARAPVQLNLTRAAEGRRVLSDRQSAIFGRVSAVEEDLVSQVRLAQKGHRRKPLL